MWVYLLVPCTPSERGYPEVYWCRMDLCTICRVLLQLIEASETMSETVSHLFLQGKTLYF